jgi:quinol monooxygenase YgiN
MPQYKIGACVLQPEGAESLPGFNWSIEVILVLGSVVATEGHAEEVLNLSQQHVQRSRTEPGCIAHAVHKDTENPNRFIFVEQWSSEEALWEHFKVPASRVFAKELAALAAEPPSIAIYSANPVQMPGKNAA